MFVCKTSRYCTTEADVKYFRQLNSDVATRPFMAELAAVSRMLPVPGMRQAVIGANGMTAALHLRAARVQLGSDRARRDVHDSRWTEASRFYRYTSNFLRSFADERSVELGRARLVRTPADHRAHPRIDRGEYYLFRDRYHLVLKSPDGTWLKSGDETVTMREGELWWIDNNAPHESWNQNAEDSIHLVFDALNANGKRMLAHAARVRTAREREASAPAL